MNPSYRGTEAPRRDSGSSSVPRCLGVSRSATLLAAAAILAAVAGAAARADQTAAAAQPAPPTFNGAVAPILFARCVGCHRPGESAPMSLLSYESVRPWARAIKARV